MPSREYWLRKDQKSVEDARQEKWSLLVQLREAFVVETDIAKRMQLEKQIKAAKQDVDSFEAESDELDQKIKQAQAESSRQETNQYQTTIQSRNSSVTSQPNSLSGLRSERGVDYSTLKHLLEKGKWKEADQETLKIFLNAAYRERQGWLKLEDFAKLPSLDICMINQLWTQYSAERFGLANQSEIWATISLSAERTKIVRDFCRACGSAERRRGLVGWWSGDRILSLEEIYSCLNSVGTPQSSPQEFKSISKGLLPAVAHWSWVETGKEVYCLSTLFARVESCRE